MSRKRHTAEQIVNKLRQADVELATGSTISAVCAGSKFRVSISRQTRSQRHQYRG